MTVHYHDIIWAYNINLKIRKIVFSSPNKITNVQ